MSLYFLAPIALSGFLLLPIVYYFLKILPPKPKRIFFPPVSLMQSIALVEATPSRAPWWVLLLRLLIASLIITAMAGPQWRPIGASLDNKHKTLIILDDGWAAANDWDLRIKKAESLIHELRNNNSPVALLISNEPKNISLIEHNYALEIIRSLKPKSYIPNYKELTTYVDKFTQENSDINIIWITEKYGHADIANFTTFLSGLQNKVQNISVFINNNSLITLSNLTSSQKSIRLNVKAHDLDKSLYSLIANDQSGQTIYKKDIMIGSGSGEWIDIDLPLELRNQISVIKLANDHSASSVVLLDDHTHLKRVGLYGSMKDEQSQPLLSSLYYIDKALSKFASISYVKSGDNDPVKTLLDEKPSILILSDVIISSEEDQKNIETFVENGGILLRFAGPLTAKNIDDFVPVRLRHNGRVLGGALSWQTPKAIKDFDRTSPFFQLSIPKDVAINKQILAEPDVGLNFKTWASLDDGTPLITANKLGRGMIILFHITADNSWSNLPISGLFVGMMERIVALSPETFSVKEDETIIQNAVQNISMKPIKLLDGYGHFMDKIPDGVLALDPLANAATRINPAGFYGDNFVKRAIQPIGQDEQIEEINLLSKNLPVYSLNSSQEIDLRSYLLIAALVLFLIDGFVTQGLKQIQGKKVIIKLFTFLAVLNLFFCQSDVNAAENRDVFNPKEVQSALKSRLAYVVTGNTNIDQTSQFGLLSLSRALRKRTSYAPADPIGVTLGQDELSLYPIIYWPIEPDASEPSVGAIKALENYLNHGGTIVFDTHDANNHLQGNAKSAERVWLEKLSQKLPIPELEPVPRDHVITKTFYLLTNIIGRYNNGQTWVETQVYPDISNQAERPIRASDSVSSVIITSNDLAAAWAEDDLGQPLYSLTSGSKNQHEMALRGGINLVMYTLTGNYKSDQVHVRDLLERLTR